ncbi:MAG: sugar ABC transporter ATP-binding protein, partial [Ilumatobacteraceae bacterium]
VALVVGEGEIVALVGHNGSGKSTLVKVLSGVHQPDPGARIWLAGADGDDATELHFIHQDLGLVEMLTTVENLDLGRGYGWRGLLPTERRSERNRARGLIARFGPSFNVEVPVARLSAAERTIVAITRALASWSHDRNVLVLDEPTAALHDDEVAKLFNAVRRVAADGAGVLFISHRLDEVLDLADRVVVLRDGVVVADLATDELDHDSLVSKITGTEIVHYAERSHTGPGDVVFRALGITGGVVDAVDIELRSGEIVGLSGVLGSGRDQLAGVVFGVLDGAVDRLTVDGRDIARLTPRSAIAAGLAYVPADRRRRGAIMGMSARENLTLPLLLPLRRRFGRLDRRAERDDVLKHIDAVGVRPRDPERPLAQFSGGNQQKVVLAKWLRTNPKVLFLDEPTQGVDVGASVAILDLVSGLARDGGAVLIASSDDNELAKVCDRVLVMRDGRIIAELRGDELTEARLLGEALGTKQPEEILP